MHSSPLISLRLALNGNTSCLHCGVPCNHNDLLAHTCAACGQRHAGIRRVRSLHVTGSASAARLATSTPHQFFKQRGRTHPGHFTCNDASQNFSIINERTQYCGFTSLLPLNCAVLQARRCPTAQRVQLARICSAAAAAAACHM